MSDESSKRLGRWVDLWDNNKIAGFHLSIVHEKLQKHSSALFQDGQEMNFFVPLCGKTLDMKWLLDKGNNVVGLEAIRKPIEDFYTEQELQWTEEDVPAVGSEFRVFKAKDAKLKLYKGDLFLCDKFLEGQFDCIWDRGSIVAIDRQDVKKYTDLMKVILKPGGKILVEVMDYDVSIYPAELRIPPPYPMTKAELQSLYEPECTVELLDADTKILADKEIGLCYYLITKKYI